MAKAGSGMELEATVEVRRGYLGFVRKKISLSKFFTGGGIAFAGWFGGKPAAPFAGRLKNVGILLVRSSATPGRPLGRPGGGVLEREPSGWDGSLLAILPPGYPGRKCVCVCVWSNSSFGVVLCALLAIVCRCYQ